MAEPLLRVDHLHVAYGPIEAVRGLSFELRPGEVLALLGANGAGKSSTLRAISGLTRFDGTVELLGRSVARRSPESLARAGLVHVPEGRRIFATLSVDENLQVAEKAAGKRAARMSIPDVYDLFPMLGPLRDRAGWALSGGEQQMRAIGRGLLGSPKLLLLDEPSLGLAPAIVDQVFDALEQISSEIPLLIVEQNTSVALDVATSAIVLAHGEPVLAGSPEELHQNDDLFETYLGTGDLPPRA